MRAPVSNTRGGGQQLESDTQALTQETTSNQGGGMVYASTAKSDIERVTPAAED